MRQNISHSTQGKSKNIEEYGRELVSFIQWQFTIFEAILHHKSYPSQLQDSTWQECQVKGAAML